MGNKKQTTTSRSDPYGPLGGYFNDASSRLTSYLNDPRSTAVYDGQRTVGPSATTRNGLAGLANNAGYGQARNYLSRTLGGEYTTAGNPHLAAMQSAVRSSVMPSVNAQFARSGMTGSTMHQGTLTRALTDGMAAPMFANYENERNRQTQAAQMLPQMDRANAENMIRAGQLSEGYDRERVAADWQKWQEQQDSPLRALQKTQGMASDIGSRFGTQTQTTQTRSNPWETALGIGMMGIGGLNGLGGLGGLFGQTVWNQPGTAMNGGWNTTARRNGFFG